MNTSSTNAMQSTQFIVTKKSLPLFDVGFLTTNMNKGRANERHWH